MKRILSFLLPLLLSINVVLICIMNLNGVNWAEALSQAHFAFSVDVSRYPVRGVDISKYQGSINWNILSKQNIRFAYIKATSGTEYIDDKFVYNWENAKKTNLAVGAYHLFTYDQPATEQAKNFINTVPKVAGTLPPAVDVELYGKDRDDPPDPEKTIKMLTEFLETLESFYDKKPVIYVTKKAYQLYIKGHFNDNPLWIRDPKAEPVLPENREWTFWQYSNNGELEGYGGENKYIDLNVFNGTAGEFSDFINNRSEKRSRKLFGSSCF